MRTRIKNKQMFELQNVLKIMQERHLVLTKKGIMKLNKLKKNNYRQKVDNYFHMIYVEYIVKKKRRK